MNNFWYEEDPQKAPVPEIGTEPVVLFRNNVVIIAFGSIKTNGQVTWEITRDLIVEYLGQDVWDLVKKNKDMKVGYYSCLFYS